MDRVFRLSRPETSNTVIDRHVNYWSMTASQANSFLAEIQVFNTDIIQLIEINGLTPNYLEKI